MKLCQKTGNGICLDCNGLTVFNTMCRYDAEQNLDLLVALLETQLTTEQLAIIDDFQVEDKL